MFSTDATLSTPENLLAMKPSAAFIWLSVSGLVYLNFMQTFGWLCCSGLLSFPRHHYPLALMRALSWLCCHSHHFFSGCSWRFSCVSPLSSHALRFCSQPLLLSHFLLSPVLNFANYFHTCCFILNLSPMGEAHSVLPSSPGSFLVSHV